MSALKFTSVAFLMTAVTLATACSNSTKDCTSASVSNTKACPASSSESSEIGFTGADSALQVDERHGAN